MANRIPGKKRQSARGPAVEKDWHPLARLRNDFETLLDRYWGQWQRLSEDFFGAGRGWSVDVVDEEQAVMVRAEAPGFEAEDFDVQIRGNQLVVTAEHRHEEEDAGRGTTTSRQGHFQRVVPLPSGIVVDQIKARYHNGVLEISIPKGPDAKRKRIAIKGE